MRDKTLNRELVTPHTSPIINSYDTGYEYSLQHYAQIQRMLEEVNREEPGEPEELSQTA